MSREIPEPIRAVRRTRSHRPGRGAQAARDAARACRCAPSAWPCSRDEGAAAVRRAGRPRRRGVHRLPRRGRARSRHLRRRRRAGRPAATATASRRSTVPPTTCPSTTRTWRSRNRPGARQTDAVTASATLVATRSPAWQPSRTRSRSPRRLQDIPDQVGDARRGRRRRGRRAVLTAEDALETTLLATGTLTPRRPADPTTPRGETGRRGAEVTEVDVLTPDGEVEAVEATVTDEARRRAGGTGGDAPTRRLRRAAATGVRTDDEATPREDAAIAEGALSTRSPASTAPTDDEGGSELPAQAAGRSRATTAGRSPSCAAASAATSSPPSRTCSPTRRPSGRASRTSGCCATAWRSWSGRRSSPARWPPAACDGPGSARRRSCWQSRGHDQPVVPRGAVAGPHGGPQGRRAGSAGSARCGSRARSPSSPAAGRARSS